jgi:hypothetical protein
MWFTVVGEIRDIEPIALGRSVRERVRLRKLYGGVRWRKRKSPMASFPMACVASPKYTDLSLTESGEKSSRSSVF